MNTFGQGAQVPNTMNMDGAALLWGVRTFRGLCTCMLAPSASSALARVPLSCGPGALLAVRLFSSTCLSSPAVIHCLCYTLQQTAKGLCTPATSTFSFPHSLQFTSVSLHSSPPTGLAPVKPTSALRVVESVTLVPISLP